MRKLIGIALCALVVLMVGTCSCSVNKNIEKSKVDSSFLKEYQDSIRVLKTENDRLFSENLQLQYLGVSFDTVFVKGDTVRNFVTIHDGNIVASGRIVSASVSKSVYTSLLASKDRTIDSLSKVKEKVETRVVTQTITKHIKRGFPWWLLLVAFALGKWGGKIFNFVKSKII